MLTYAVLSTSGALGKPEGYFIYPIFAGILVLLLSFLSFLCFIFLLSPPVPHTFYSFTYFSHLFVSCLSKWLLFSIYSFPSLLTAFLLLDYYMYISTITVFPPSLVTSSRSLGLLTRQSSFHFFSILNLILIPAPLYSISPPCFPGMSSFVHNWWLYPFHLYHF